LAPISGEQIIPIQRPAKTEPIEKISSHTTSAPASLAAKTTPQNQPSSSFLKSGSQINYGTKIKPTPDSPSTTIPTPSPKPESKPVAPSPTPSTKKSFFGFLFGKKSASRTSSPTLDASEKPTPTKSEKPIEPVKTAPIAGPKKEPTTLTPVPTNPAAKTAPNPNNLAAQNPNQANVFKNARKEITATLSETAKPKNDISYVDLRSHKIPKEILAKIPEYIARLYQAIPVEEKNGKLIVAMVDPEDYQAIEFIKKKTGAEIKPALATQEDIGHVLEQYSEFESEIAQEIKKATPEKETKTKEDQEEDIAKAEAPTSRAVQSILKRAVLSEASDIHIEPYEKEVIVRFRIDGVLQEVVSLPKSIQPAVISRIKILGNLKIDETRLPQDGRFGLTVNKRKIDFRLSVFPTVYGEKAVMRILDKSGGVLTLEELGFRGEAFSRLNDAISKSHGMILVTGPTGSGKSTTLYAVLGKLNKEGVNIITLEDPVEYQIKGINQGQVRTDIGFTFAKGLRSIVRQDPDIIMVGEIRDLETAEMAVHAALTGHVVLSTLHTNDAAGAVPRMIDMGVEPFLVTSSVNTVVAQRLTRKVCEHCKQKEPIADEILTEIKQELAKLPEKEKKELDNREMVFYKGKGCTACNNIGYKGRVGIFEVFALTEPMRNLILKKVSSQELATKAISEGMITMKQDGILKALDGITTVEEVWRVTRE